MEVDVADTYTPVTGSLMVTKDIAGPAAGQQGPVTIQVSCDGVDPSLTPDFADPRWKHRCAIVYLPRPAGRSRSVWCSRASTAARPPFWVSVSAYLQTRQNCSGRSNHFGHGHGHVLAQTGRHSGRKSSSRALGRPAGSSSRSTPRVAATRSPSFVIPAGTPAGLQLHFSDHIPAGSTCTVTETADGSTSTVTTTVLGGDSQTLTVATGAVVPAVFADIFTDPPGTLTVTKNIAGAGAGMQGPIAILVDCGQPIDQFAFLIPAGTPAGSVSRSFDEIPAGSTCTTTETSNGATTAVAVAVTGSGQQVAVGEPGRGRCAHRHLLSDSGCGGCNPNEPGGPNPCVHGLHPGSALLAVLGIAAIGTGGFLVVLGRLPRHRRRGRWPDRRLS